jgi:F0F1-type ATP synthase assembly protein I
VAKPKTSRVVFTHITIGLQLAMTVLIFVYGGFKLDERYNKSPLFVTLGAALGMCLGFYHLIKELNQENKREKHESEDTRKKIRWM